MGAYERRLDRLRFSHKEVSNGFIYIAADMLQAITGVNHESENVYIADISKMQDYGCAVRNAI